MTTVEIHADQIIACLKHDLAMMVSGLKLSQPIQDHELIDLERALTVFKAFNTVLEYYGEPIQTIDWYKVLNKHSDVTNDCDKRGK